MYEELADYDALINSIVYMELIQGTRDKKELNKIDKFLKQFEIIPIDTAVSLEAVALMKIYYLSHGLLIPDALIAATSIIKNIPLWTFNKKDFRFIEKVNLVGN